MISLLTAELALLSLGSKTPLVVKARSLIRGFCASNCTTTVKSVVGYFARGRNPKSVPCSK